MQLYIFIFSGFVLSLIFNFTGVEEARWYSLAVATLLAAGLYSSTFGISLKDARQHLGIIIRAITIGVLVKALIIGAIMTIVLQNPFGFILGIIVAQIDPLSTAALLKGNRMSTRAKAILGSWAAFDDPMTVILSLYAPMIIAFMLGLPWEPIGGSIQAAGLGGYIAETAINLGFAAGVIILWLLIKRHAKAVNMAVIVLVALAMYGLLVGALSTAIFYFWMLGIAVIGLFMRPPIEPVLNHAVKWALNMAAILLGILLINGINIGAGVVLGLAAYCAQICVGLLLTQKLPWLDRLHISLAQQNGITAIILALLFEPYYPGTIAIVAPAIIVINTCHALANTVLDAHLHKENLHIHHYLGRLKKHVSKI